VVNSQVLADKIPLVNANQVRNNQMQLFRDQHLSLIRPVLRVEASNLEAIGNQLNKAGHVADISPDDSAHLDPITMLWPDALSRDLENHFPQYASSKQTLFSNIQTHDKEFKTAFEMCVNAVPHSKDWIVPGLGGLGFLS
jgi:hypothetical protein